MGIRLCYQRYVGYTLLELMTVVVVISILATIAVGQFAGMTEKGRRGEAHSGILTIQAGQKVYYSKNGQYRTTSADVMDSAEMTALGIVLNQENWGFKVTSSDPKTNYLITAKRLSGAQINKTIMVDNQGVWRGDWVW